MTIKEALKAKNSGATGTTIKEVLISAEDVSGGTIAEVISQTISPEQAEPKDNQLTQS